MELRNFKELNKHGAIRSVEIQDSGSGEPHYTVWAENGNLEMEPITLTRPDPDRPGLPERSWTDLNRAMAFVRRHGWNGPVVVRTV